MNDSGEKGNTLILGLGNDILSDDGIGPYLVREISNILENPRIQFQTACCGGLEIMEYIKDFARVIIIDAIHPSDGKAGEVYYLTPDNFRETSNLSSIHDVNFLTTIRLGNELGLNMPDEIHIIAIGIVEDMQFSEELTPYLKERLPEIISEVVSIVRQILV